MISTILLTIAFALATHLIRLCHRTPNVPDTKYENDKLFAIPLVKEYGPTLLQCVFVVPCIYHTILTVTFKNLESSAICPHPDHVDAKYFSWSTYTIVSLALIFVSATLRLFAFQTLGKNFTFQLAQPDRLVTSGMYAYVQHPSYGPLFVLVSAPFMLFLPFDGALGCFLPWPMVQLWISWRWFFLASVMAITCVAVGVRVRDEEAMLKETFGKEWLEWHRRTPRFVPFLW